MKGMRVGAAVLLLVFAISSAAAAGQSPKAPKIKIHAKGEVFCPAAALVFGNIVISASRCYILFVMRDSRGTFLAFAAPDAKIPPGQLVRLNTPAGAKLKGRIFYLVPIQTTAVVVPVNSIRLVAVRAEDFGPRLTITLTSVPAPNVTLTFQVRL